MAGHFLLSRRVRLLPASLLLALLTLNSVVGQEGGVPSALVSALRQREQSCLRLETEWDWTRDVPGDPAAVRRLEQDIQRALQSHPPAERAKVEPGIRRMYSALAYGYREQTRWVLRGLGDKYAFWGDLPVIGKPEVRAPYRAIIYPNGVLVDGRIVQPFAQWVLHEPVLLIMMAGMNPLELLQDVQVSLMEDGRGLVIVQGRMREVDARYSNYASDKPLRITIDLSKGGAVTRIQFTRPEGRKGEVVVREWERYRGLWLPSSIILTGGAWGSSQHLSLIGVRDSSLKPPEWFRERASVTDTRLVTPGEEGVTYRLSERLPSLQELESMRTRATDGKGLLRSPWWRIIPPLLLITIGVLWYLRVRQGERKT
jgi:hypothetical protein